MEADPLSLHRDPHPVRASFDVSVSFEVPASSSETPLAPRPIPSVDVGAQEHLSYKVVTNASKRGKTILTDTRGHRYNKKSADKRCSSSKRLCGRAVCDARDSAVLPRFTSQMVFLFLDPSPTHTQQNLVRTKQQTL
ncbi:hypothetical protein GWK47_000372 [Chionoecetes opilio]|uniref:Uncharacterized protein n=1 Tax=Chionoecetes opilio TaxID=41210 RepID=A0A8J5D353_CHIOP|nr:hypothetical protein GWK47_000372 [Chionoecetes opilio]